MGRLNIALEASTEENYKIDALKPLLIDLGNKDDPKIIRQVSWQAAYYYHYLHPRGADLGYVELVSESPEIDLFLLFSHDHENESPYAAVIYAKNVDQLLSRTIADKWVERLFPESIQGRRQYESFYFLYSRGFGYKSYDYERGFIKFHFGEGDEFDGFIAPPEEVNNVIISYRSSSPWNPKDLL